jgi:hypothetical protein
MKWKIRDAVIWRGNDEDFEEIFLATPGDADLHLIDADSLEGTACLEDADEEFVEWAHSRRGRCKICGALGVEVDCLDHVIGPHEHAIKIACPHGDLVVLYHVA